MRRRIERRNDDEEEDDEKKMNVKEEEVAASSPTHCSGVSLPFVAADPGWRAASVPAGLDATSKEEPLVDPAFPGCEGEALPLTRPATPPQKRELPLLTLSAQFRANGTSKVTTHSQPNSGPTVPHINHELSR
ncbi:hypothetical protein LSTR_LSTR001462 [Laodelphax striatellus]|uniref:Uncharacterized protein n=1 Tax=Laodelphax striatellus TaxID=195883 RepID=A0A482XAE4_LAOST|nr:hypothetical protein LSTR_LSTR001462 [Laodelphax striatellus]